ncbi:hypothetical protein PARC_p0042 (plasmid) [Pseudoalteromonas arctica A 37-1-2]|uniref:Resolvase HTH domain-containing protein n=1 Tax=Pseudoalteromonas arctica A 37-1-2 TaxID=1117313 RepID=A0A290SC12_9GAMM|nr:hypothetical protein PARC_p0042 [Pseudoalteromonas arctica A 37-1-2]
MHPPSLLGHGIHRHAKINQWVKYYCQRYPISRSFKPSVSLDLPTSHLTFGSFPSDDFMRSILSAINNMLLEILAASAYKEYRERERKQKEGIVKAQQKGLYHGRQPDLEAHDRIASFTEAGFSINKTAEAVGVSRSTVIRVRKKLKNLD